jgi:hypothetical protein
MAPSKLWRLSDTARHIVERALASDYAEKQREHIYRDTDRETILANLNYPGKRWCAEDQRAIFLGLNETGRAVLARVLVFSPSLTPELQDELKRLSNRHSRGQLSTLSLNARLRNAKSEEHRQDLIKRNFREEQGTK